MVKLPARPPAGLAITADDLITVHAGTVLWRIHPTAGKHVTPWNTLRFYGPTTSRFDPHPPPPRSHAGYGVAYAAFDPYTTFAEVYQRARTINRAARRPYLTAWRTSRPLSLLDLTGSWPTANGASHAINTGRHDYCRAWANTIHDHPAHVDGLLHTSAMAGTQTLTLFTPARDSFPVASDLSRALIDPALSPIVDAAAGRFRYAIV